jgi:HK97 family phage major capsid protein
MVKMIETVEAGAAQLRAKAMADFEAGFAAELKKRMEPNLATVRAISEDKPTRETSQIRVLDPRQHLYERMKRQDPEMAIYRTPDSDHWTSQWIRAMSFGNQAAMAQASDEIAKIYGRATLAEGTTTAVSGLSNTGVSAAPFIPLPLAGMVQLALNRSAKMRSLCSVFQSDAKTLRVPKSSVATAAMAAEGAIAAQGEPTMGSVLLDKKKMQAQFGASKETLRDSSFDLTAFFAERAGAAFGQLEDVEICTAASTPTVTAVLTFTNFAEASANTLTYVDIVNMWYDIPEQYQANATWLCGGPMGSFLSRLAYSGGIAPVLVPANPSYTIGDGANVQGTIFGRPVVICPLAAGVLTCANLKIGYGILDDGGVEVESSNHAGWSTDTILWKFTRRFDGAVLLADAGRTCSGITAIA